MTLRGDSFRLIVEAGEAAAKPAPVPETGHDHDHGLEEPPLPAPPVAYGQRREFPGNDHCLEVFQQVALFEATRDLGVPEAGDLAGFGLDAPEDALVVSTGRGEERFALGKVLYGTSKRNVRREANGKLYVVNTAFLEEMKSDSYFETLEVRAKPGSYEGAACVVRGLRDQLEEKDSASLSVRDCDCSIKFKTLRRFFTLAGSISSTTRRRLSRRGSVSRNPRRRWSSRTRGTPALGSTRPRFPASGASSKVNAKLSPRR